MLQEVKIVNPNNNSALRTTSYEYKKGNLAKTTQTQGTNTVVKNYSYNKQDELVAVEVWQNGELSLNEYYELDGEGRRTKISRKLPDQAETKVTSTYTYTTADGKLTSVENRFTDQGEFVITKVLQESNKRDISELTKRVSDGQQALNQQFFEDDAQGNWVKGEVIGDQYSRSRLVLRKITYTDGTTSGREKLTFPDDYHAQFIRQYSQKQVAVNGKVYGSSVAFDLDYTKDRLTWVYDLNAWVLLKGYDNKSSMTKWAEAQVIGGGRDEVYWAASSSGIDVFNAGKKYGKGTRKTNFSGTEVGGSVAAYIRGDINQSFVAEYPAKSAGKLIKAALSTDHFQWAKASDSTYILTNRGRSVSLQKQIEDSAGNKLAMYKQGSVYYWYFLPDFRARYDGREIGKFHNAEQIYDREKFLTEDKLKADLSEFTYTKLANTRYRLLTKDGLSVTNIASKTIKTPDDKLFTYFPLTDQYLHMAGFYGLEKGKEWPNQKVNVVLDSSAYIYYLYNNNESINFYTPDGRIEKRVFSNHKLYTDRRVFGAVVYDSLSNVSYGMTYDLDKDQGFGAMRKLIANPKGAYLLKLDGGRWVVFVKGQKEGDYTFSKQTEDGKSVVHFYKNEKGETRAFHFPGFDEAVPGQFIYAYDALRADLKKWLDELGVDPDLNKDKQEELPRRQASTYDREGDMLYIRNGEGDDIGHRLSKFWTLNQESDLIAYDSVSGITYKVVNYFGQETTIEGRVEVLIGSDEVKAFKLGKSKLHLAANGVFTSGLLRAYITQDPEDEVWKEVAYDRTADVSYLVSYPSDSGFYMAEVQKLPVSNFHTYLFKVKGEKFVVIKKGRTVRQKEIRYRKLGDDLISLEVVEGLKVGNRFRGYKQAGEQELLVAEPLVGPALDKAWEEAGEALKATAKNTEGYQRPTDKWMQAIDRCGENAACSANLIDQMGKAILKGGYTKEQMLEALVPYFRGVAEKNKERLFQLVMKIDSPYVGVTTLASFPKELRDFVRARSQEEVKKYTDKHGKPQIKTVPYKKKGGNG